MHCGSCGKENPDDALFCANCGATLNGKAKKPAAATAPATGESKFVGGAFKNMLMAVATFFVSLLTLMLARPAMLCWRQRWLAKNTYINGKQLEFTGKALDLEGKYILRVFLSVITLGIYYFVAMGIWFEKWRVENTHFNGSEGCVSVFDGSVGGFVGTTLLTGFVSYISLGIASYWAYCHKRRWFSKHTVYDGCRLEFDGYAIQYFLKTLLWRFLTAITLGIYGLWLTVKERNWVMSHTHVTDVSQIPDTSHVKEKALTEREEKKFAAFAKHGFKLALAAFIIALLAAGLQTILPGRIISAINAMRIAKTIFILLPCVVTAPAYLTCATLCSIAICDGAPLKGNLRKCLIFDILSLFAFIAAMLILSDAVVLPR